MLQNRSLIVRSLLASTLVGSLLCPSSANGYEAGTFTLSPLNVTVSSLMLGYKHKDSRFISTGFIVGQQVVAPTRRIDTSAYGRIWPMGFSESDRNGYGYGFEAGYTFIKNVEVFGRAGYCQENPEGRFVVGDRSYDFKRRDNYGFTIGLRYYFESASAWKPFLAGNVGVNWQGPTKANIFWHSPFSQNVDTEPEIGQFRLIGRKILPTFQLMVGTDYNFTKNVAMSMSVGLRYNDRGGSTIINTPGRQVGNANLPARSDYYGDNKSHWYVPITFSLKFII